MTRATVLLFTLLLAACSEQTRPAQAVNEMIESPLQDTVDFFNRPLSSGAPHNHRVNQRHPPETIGDQRLKGNLQDKRAGKLGCRRQFVLSRGSWRL
jgi:hypothetical protein